MSKNKNSDFQIKLPIFITLAVAAGILIGATMAGGDSSTNNFISSYLKFKDILTYIQRDYVDKVDTDELVEVAITKMLEELDPHSVYIPAKELEMAKSELEGEFEGIGIEFNIFKDTIYVVSPLSGGPSEAVGLMSGDKIVKVDGETVAGIGIDNRDVMELLRGTKGSTVEVGIKRRGSDELLDFTITRDKIPQESVEASFMVDNEIGYIKISRFAATTYDEFREALSELKAEGMEKMILDLRGNPGGYLDRAVNIADEMLSDNKMIVYTEGKQPRYNTEARAYKDGLFEESPIIVLIDEGSASASEIVAGALQDNDRGLIVGRRSFGKGLVQMPVPLDDGSELRLTISRYYTPSGRSIQKPYGGDAEAYNQDLYNRFEHGEMFSKDSIQFNDSLKYKTTKGRTVYGGGGIMPDYFIPLDTSQNIGSFFGELITTNVFREYTLLYYENNRKQLEKMSYKKYYSDFEVSEKMLDELQAMAGKAGIEYTQEEFEESKPVLKSRIKAWVGRSVWGNDAFYQIIYEDNDIFQRALKLFDEAEELASR